MAPSRGEGFPTTCMFILAPMIRAGQLIARIMFQIGQWLTIPCTNIGAYHLPFKHPALYAGERYYLAQPWTALKGYRYVLYRRWMNGADLALRGTHAHLSVCMNDARADTSNLIGPIAPLSWFGYFPIALSIHPCQLSLPCRSTFPKSLCGLVSSPIMPSKLWTQLVDLPTAVISRVKEGPGPGDVCSSVLLPNFSHLV